MQEVVAAYLKVL